MTAVTTPDPQRVERLSDAEVDALLAPIIHASGSRLSYYTMPKTRSDMRTALRAALSAADAIQPPQRDEVRLVRHKKRGTTYEVIGEADLQTERPISDYEVLTVYKGPDGRLWARPSTEFEDGRFEDAALATTTDAAGGGNG